MKFINKNRGLDEYHMKAFFDAPMILNVGLLGMQYNFEYKTTKRFSTIRIVIFELGIGRICFFVGYPVDLPDIQYVYRKTVGYPV